MKKIVIGIIVIVLFLVAIVIFKGFFTGKAISEGDVKIPLSELSENVKWYSYSSNGITIRYLAVKADDGSIKTAFDACDVCYKNKKGYRQEGKYLVCNNCGRKFLINGLGTENKNPGGCWPGYLPSYADGNEIVIKQSDLQKGAWRF